MDNRSEARENVDCATCLADGRGRCEPFASAGHDKCSIFPECCTWCRITWCPSNRSRELYASLNAGEQLHDQAAG